MAQVKELSFISRAVKTKNPIHRFFFGSETKRKRLLRRLSVVKSQLFSQDYVLN